MRAERSSRAVTLSAHEPVPQTELGLTKSSAWQASLILAVWLFVVGLHWSNNGLWYQGDAARHAANGLFWQTYLSAPTLEAKEFALSYYARYPVVNPVAYPPFFYLVEAGVYWLFGSSALVAKNLVLVFALFGTFYFAAWLRRWVSPHVVWSAALILLLPGMIRWSHAVMLNVPALALSIASVYHGRRWAESGGLSLRSAHPYLMIALAALAILTYYPAGVVLFVLVTVVLIGGGWRLFTRWQILVMGGAAAILLVPCYLLLARWNSSQIEWLIKYSVARMWSAKSWLFYVERLPALFGWTTLVLASVGLGAGLSSSRWRREALLLSAWLAVTYAFFSIVMYKDPRYILSLGPPMVGLCATGTAWIADHLSSATAKRRLASAGISVLGMAVVLGTQALVALRTEVPSIRGFAEVVAFLKEVAPNEPVFYDGAAYNGAFTFLVQADDPERERAVVLGNKLLYSYSYRPGARQTQYVSSAEDVVNVLRTQGGCRWLAIERGDRSLAIPAMRYLRRAVERPEFELVRSFPVVGRNVHRVDVYRMLGPIREQTTVRLPFPYVSKNTFFEVEPIAPRAGSRPHS